MTWVEILLESYKLFAVGSTFVKFYSIFLIGMNINRFNPFTWKFKKYILPNLKEKRISGVVRIGDRIIFQPSKVWSQVLHTVWCNISGETAREFQLDQSWKLKG